MRKWKLWLPLALFLIFPGLVLGWAGEPEHRKKRMERGQPVPQNLSSDVDSAVNIRDSRDYKDLTPSINPPGMRHSPRTCAYTPLSAGAGASGVGVGIGFGKISEDCLRVQRIQTVDHLGYSPWVANEMKQIIFNEDPKNKLALEKGCRWISKHKGWETKAPECVNLFAMQKKKAETKKKEDCFGCNFLK